MTAHGLIDLHSHVLPGIDDGPPDVEASLELARAAAEAGTTILVATPHVNHRWIANEAKSILPATAALRRAIDEAGIPLQLRTGAEVALTRAAELSPAELQLLRLGGGGFLLVECPETPSAAGFEATLDVIAGQGNRILLAHVERIPGFRSDPGVVERLVGRGMLTQITAASLSGAFGDRALSSARDLLAAGLVHVISSDAHAATRRGPDIGKHLEGAGIEPDAIDYFTRVAPEAILFGGRLDPPPVVARKRSRRLSLKRAS